MSAIDVQIEEWLNVCWDIMISEPSEAIQYADRALANSLQDSEAHSSARYYRGLCLMYQGDFNGAFNELSEALNHANEHGFFMNASRVNNGLGMVNHANGRYGAALDHFDLTVQYAKEQNETERMVPPLVNMSKIFFDMGDIESASEQLDEIDQLDVQLTEDNLVEFYLLRARIFIDKMEFDQAEIYLDKANKLAVLIDYASFILRGQDVLGRLRRLQGRLNEAKKIFRKVIVHPDLAAEGSDAVLPYIELSKLLISQGELKESINVMEEGLSQVKPHDRSPQNIRALEQLSYAYELAGDVKNNARTLSMLVESLKYSSGRQGRNFLDLRRFKHQQEKAQFQQKLLDQENTALKKEHDRLEFLNDIAHQLASTLDYLELGDRLYNIFSQKTNVHFLSLVTSDAESQRLKFQFAIERNEHIFSPDILFDAPDSKSVQALLTRKVVVINDALKVSNINYIGASEEHARTMLFLPLIQENEVIGVFSIQSPLPSQFSEEEIQLFEAVTTFISIAVSNIQSHETVRQLNKILSLEKQEIENSQQKIAHMAYHDSLTSLPNRQSLITFIDQQIAKADLHKKHFHLVYIDLDGFKPVNDQYGHRVGDEVLIVISKRIQDALRANDFAARVGGDEFVLIIDSFAQKEAVSRFLERLLKVIQEPIAVDTFNLLVSASIGAAQYPDQGDDLDRLMHSADQAMYAIKRSGKGGFQFVESS